MAEGAKNVDISFLATNLKRLRSEKGLSMQQLANIAEIEKSQVSRIEYGESDPRLSTILRIAQALGVTLQELLKSSV